MSAGSSSVAGGQPRVRKHQPLSEFARYIRSERVKRQLTQEEVGKRIGSGPSYISHLERGIKKDFRLSFLEKYARALGIELHTFLAESGVRLDPDPTSEDADALRPVVRELQEAAGPLPDADIRRLRDIAYSWRQRNVAQRFEQPDRPEAESE